MKNLLNNSYTLLILALGILISILQPLTINSNDAYIYCDVVYPTIQNGENPYIDENLYKNKNDSVPELISFPVGYNHPPILISALNVLCSEDLFNWRYSYPLLFILNFLFASLVLFRKNIAEDNIKVSLFYFFGLNSTIFAYKSGNLTLFAHTLLILCFILFSRKFIFLSSIVFSFYLFFKIQPVFLIVILFFFRKEKDIFDFIKYTIATSAIIFSSQLFFYYDLTLSWINKVLLPNQLFKTEIINEYEVSTGVLGNPDHPTLLNLFIKLRELNIILGVFFLIVSLFFIYYSVKSLHSYESDTVLIYCFLVYFLCSYYFRSYSLIDLNLFLSLWMMNNPKYNNLILLLFCIVPQIQLILIPTSLNIYPLLMVTMILSLNLASFLKKNTIRGKEHDLDI